MASLCQPIRPFANFNKERSGDSGRGERTQDAGCILEQLSSATGRDIRSPWNFDMTTGRRRVITDSLMLVSGAR